AILSAHTHPPYNEPNYPVPVHITFIDWIPGLYSLGILVVNLVNKDRMCREDGFGDLCMVWCTHLILFIDFALMAGSLVGSMALLVLKYVIPRHPEYQYYGYANIVENMSLMLSVVMLWITHSKSG
ncbi:hypothetical protein BJV78DRAFT_1080105, partial [Lactifluus subvellereus]